MILSSAKLSESHWIGLNIEFRDSQPTKKGKLLPYLYLLPNAWLRVKNSIFESHNIDDRDNIDYFLKEILYILYGLDLYIPLVV